MKKIILFLLIIASMVILSGCTYSESRQANIAWDSDDFELHLRTQGGESSKVYGTIEIENNVIEIVGMFYWNQSSLCIYTRNQVESNEVDLDDVDPYIIFDIIPVFLSNSSIKLKTRENEPGYDILGDLKITLNISEIKNEDRNAKYFLLTSWYNETSGIYFHNNYNTIYSNISYGTIQVEDEIIDIEFIYIDEENYAIQEVESSQLIISGEYYLDGDNLVLLVDNDEYFQNQYESLIFLPLAEYA